MKMNTNTEKHTETRRNTPAKRARKTRPQKALAPHAHPHHEVHQNPAGGGNRLTGVSTGQGGWCTSWGETPSP